MRRAVRTIDVNAPVPQQKSYAYGSTAPTKTHDGKSTIDADTSPPQPEESPPSRERAIDAAGIIAAYAPAPDDDELAVEARLAAIEGRLQSTTEIIAERAEGNEPRYQTFLSRVRHERDEQARLESLRAAAAAKQAEEAADRADLVASLRRTLADIVDHVDGWAAAFAEERELARIAALDAALRSEAGDRITKRQQAEAARDSARAALDRNMLHSADPLVEEIRIQSRARIEAAAAAEALQAAEEERLLEEELARLTSLRPSKAL